ncbi:MAG TPA: hypothetical protein PKD54_13450, partial [Pirellulaceae bacterium]|nr:hypothetical protein [Pirellulaceae bacterium]
MIIRSATTAYQFAYQQEDLETICEDRQLVTSEIHPANDFYGQASVIKRYVGLPNDYQLKAVVEHGVMYMPTMWEYDRLACLASNLAYSRYRATLQRRSSGKPSLAIGSGFHYAKQLVDREHAPVERRGTIAFPCHSSHTILYTFDYDDYARRLQQLPDWMQPVYVCVYWKDVLRGHHLPYVQAGLPVVSAGHMYDSDFMLRSYDICRRFQFAVGNDIGSYLFNAIISGCKFSYVHSGDIEIQIPENELQNVPHGRSDFQAIQAECARLFAELTPELTPQQIAFVNRFVGLDCVQSPAALRRILRRTEFFDRWYPVRSPASPTSPHWVLPPSWHRSMVNVGRFARKVSRSIRK